MMPVRLGRSGAVRINPLFISGNGREARFLILPTFAVEEKSFAGSFSFLVPIKLVTSESQTAGWN